MLPPLGILLAGAGIMKTTQWHDSGGGSGVNDVPVTTVDWP